MTRVYRGVSQQDTAATDLVLVYDDGELAGPLRHHVRHSPTGFGHGYAGSGPADLARSLLIDALGDDARCPICAGTGRVVYDLEAEIEVPARDRPDAGPELISGCWNCDDGIRRLPYQDFKNQYVAQWPQDGGWEISRDEIRRWYERSR